MPPSASNCNAGHWAAADVGKVTRGEADFGPLYASQCVQAIDAGERMTLLAGVMVGCFELFARELIRRQPILYRGEIGSSGGAARTGMSGPARQASKQVCLDAGQSARVSVQRHQPSHSIVFYSPGHHLRLPKRVEGAILASSRRESGHRPFNRIQASHT
jgi:hypothetical protein